MLWLLSKQKRNARFWVHDLLDRYENNKEFKKNEVYIGNLMAFFLSTKEQSPIYFTNKDDSDFCVISLQSDLKIKLVKIPGLIIALNDFNEKITFCLSDSAGGYDLLINEIVSFGTYFIGLVEQCNIDGNQIDGNILFDAISWFVITKLSEIK